MRYIANRIYNEFSGTSYGQNMAESPRYERFMPEGWLVDQWGLLMGDDMNNLYHMRETIENACWLIENENQIQPGTFSFEDAVKLTITAALHDQGEAIVGDIEYGRKTADKEMAERTALRDYESVFVPGLSGRALDIYRIGRDEIAFGDKNEKLPGAFTTIELIGFINNTLRALQQLRRLRGVDMSDRKLMAMGIRNDSDRHTAREVLERLVAEVLGSGVLEMLIHMANRYSGANEYLKAHSSEISLGFNQISQKAFDWYESKIQARLKAKKVGA